MDEPTWDELELREVITFAPPGGVLRPGDYPWLAAVQICLKGGDGGTSGNGTPGEIGQTLTMTYRRDQLPAELKVRVGRGGKGEGAGVDGQDAFGMIALWARKGDDRG